MSDAIATWWQAFEQQAPRIDALFKQQDEWDLSDWMQDHLNSIHPDLMWEFGPAVNGPGHRLVITPENRRELRPLVRDILRRAPALPGWEFYEFRLAESLENAALMVEGRTGGDIQGIQVQICPGDFHRVDLLFMVPSSEADPFAVAFVATECLLGEEALDRWVGVIDVQSEPAPDGPDAIDISELPAHFQQRVVDIQDRLPDRPWHMSDIETADWTGFRLERPQADDYADQSDLIVGITLLPEMWRNALMGVPFDSVRHSRCGERFCYLKIDGVDGLDASRFDDRAEIEDALNEQLRPTGQGSVVGGGTGLRYSYIELALTDVEAAWTTVRSILREGNLPRRTWLLFHDDELGAEWRGLYDESPSPPTNGED